jgi:hypothetical protein
MILIALVLASSTVPGNLPEPATQDAAWTYGEGIRSCGEWTSDHREESHGYYTKLSWLGGFLSGLNVSYRITGVSNILEGTDLHGAVGWIDNYCVANPLKNISTAAGALALEILQRRIKQ